MQAATDFNIVFNISFFLFFCLLDFLIIFFVHILYTYYYTLQVINITLVCLSSTKGKQIGQIHGKLGRFGFQKIVAFGVKLYQQDIEFIKKKKKKKNKIRFQEQYSGFQTLIFQTQKQFKIYGCNTSTKFGLVQSFKFIYIYNFNIIFLYFVWNVLLKFPKLVSSPWKIDQPQQIFW
eukprot:TRINITY_DN6071_c0_g1_i9.p2 TRINITY_DN6071_c0_g1~~TRINITY_DN6071_c0_g1_i9.p2  ORF type:complete len:177 (-),score=0.17 TRINITY_DN6071_c0_g1_i9:205-735(-)